MRIADLDDRINAKVNTYIKEMKRHRSEPGTYAMEDVKESKHDACVIYLFWKDTIKNVKPC